MIRPKRKATDSDLQPPAAKKARPEAAPAASVAHLATGPSLDNLDRDIAGKQQAIAARDAKYQTHLRVLALLQKPQPSAPANNDLHIFETKVRKDEGLLATLRAECEALTLQRRQMAEARFTAAEIAQIVRYDTLLKNVESSARHIENVRNPSAAETRRYNQAKRDQAVIATKRDELSRSVEALVAQNAPALAALLAQEKAKLARVERDLASVTREIADYDKQKAEAVNRKSDLQAAHAATQAEIEQFRGTKLGQRSAEAVEWLRAHASTYSQTRREGMWRTFHFFTRTITGLPPFSCTRSGTSYIVTDDTDETLPPENVRDFLVRLGAHLSEAEAGSIFDPGPGN